MIYRRLSLILVLALAPLGCAPRSVSSGASLDPHAELLSVANGQWRAEQARRLSDFETANRTTLWTITQELSGRTSAAWPPPDAPIRLGRFDYFSADSPGSRYPVFYRRTDGGSAEVVLDLNREFPTGTVDIGLLRIAPDNTAIAVSLDTTGTGDYRLYTRPLPDGALSSPIGNSVHEAEWGAEGSVFFTELEGLRATKLFRTGASRGVEAISLTVGSDGHLALHPSGDGQIIVREIAPRGGKAWRIPAGGKKVTPTRLVVGGPTWRSATTIDGCTFEKSTLLLVERAGRRELVWLGGTPSAQPEALPLGSEEPSVTGIRCHKRHAVAFGRAGNRGALWYLATENSPPSFTRVATPFGLTALTLGAHASPEVSVVRVQLSSLINPPILYELDLESGSFSPRAQMEVTNHRAERYTTAQLAARAPDGVAVPITVAYQPGDSPTTPLRPLILTTYGAYGANASTEFTDFYLPLLERGFVIAVAHIRGGGEGGPAWHESSRGGKKVVGTTDLIAAAETLQRLGWGGSRRTALLGRSAGAIAIAGAAALRPDLFGAVVLDAPFLDPIGALSDTTRPLVLRDRVEWGDPTDSGAREAMTRYSPFERAIDRTHPPTLVTVRVNDTAVSPMDGARWIQRLNGSHVKGNLFAVGDGTHSGSPTRADGAKEAALRATFILTTLGIQ